MPTERSVLNYRLIGFSFPQQQNITICRLEIAAGNYNDADSFKKNSIITMDTRNTRIITEVPSFGKYYTWRVTYTISHSKTVYSPLYHFSTGSIPSVDTSIKRLRILKNAEEYKDAFVFLDNNRVLCNMKGEAVWYLPDIGNLHGEYPVRDLKLTPQGTITLLAGDEGYEITYNGTVLWRTPDNKKEYYHHEFTRLSNGHYMILGGELENIYLDSPASPLQSGMIVFNDSDANVAKYKARHGSRFYAKQEFPKVMEYDTKGRLIWVYRTARYFNGSDLYFHRAKDGTLETKVHDNGFYLDENAGTLYISCKDISRVIKVKYPEGNTLDTYGEIFAPGAVQNRGKGFFCGQHNCRISNDGYLYLYNNNSCNARQLPVVTVMSEPVSKNDSLKKVWEYQCTIDEIPAEEQNKLNFISSGAVCELPGDAMFVNMGGQYSKVFIVNKNKDILWSAIPEKWQPEMNKWMPLSQYRASIISDRQDLEKLIWRK